MFETRSCRLITLYWKLKMFYVLCVDKMEVHGYFRFVYFSGFISFKVDASLVRLIVFYWKIKIFVYCVDKMELHYFEFYEATWLKFEVRSLYISLLWFSLFLGCVNNESFSVSLIFLLENKNVCVCVLTKRRCIVIFWLLFSDIRRQFG